MFDVPRAFYAWVFPYVIHRHLCTVAKASAIGLATPSISIQPRGMEAESWPHRVLQLLKTTVNRLPCSMALEGDRCGTSCMASEFLCADMPPPVRSDLLNAYNVDALGHQRYALFSPNEPTILLGDQHETISGSKRARPWSGMGAIANQDVRRSMTWCPFPCFQPQIHQASRCHCSPAATCRVLISCRKFC